MNCASQPFIPLVLDYPNLAGDGTIVLAPTNLTAPTLTGVAQEGQTLTGSNGTWTGSPTSFTYSYKRGVSTISGATSPSYVLTSADVGSTITRAVVASNAGGPSLPALSAASSVVAPISSPPVTADDSTAYILALFEDI